MQSEASKNNVVISDDSELVILLCYYQNQLDSIRLVHAVLSKVVNEEKPRLEH